jgi:hypothetical protein
MAQSNPAVRIAAAQKMRNCNWSPDAPGYPLRTCDDMQRIFEQKPTRFLAKEDYLDVGLRECEGVKYVVLIREPLDRIRSNIIYGKFTAAQVHDWSAGGGEKIEPGLRRSYPVCV